MASSRVAATSSTVRSDLARQISINPLAIGEMQNSVSGDQARILGSMSMDDLLRNMYGDGAAMPFGGGGEAAAAVAAPPPAVAQQGSFSVPKDVGSMTVEEVWREINRGRRPDNVGGGGGGGGEEAAGGEMTLEDFLARAGAVREEDVRVPIAPTAAEVSFGVESVMGNRFNTQLPQQQQQQQQQQQVQLPIENPILGFGNGIEDGAGGTVGRGRKRRVMDPVDKAALQRQKRMIKNRESAARSRERKQAYTVELESLVTQLEVENARLLKEQEELDKLRLKQLMEYLIPVTEKKRPRRALRRTQSFQL